MISHEATPIGWYLLANAYAKSASKLLDEKLRVPHSESPPRFLYYHAIELFLKSYLVVKGASEKDVKKFNHQIEGLGARCKNLGLPIGLDTMEALRMVDYDGNVFAARYLKIGMRHHLSLKALMDVVTAIKVTVRRELKSAGIPVR
jgi:hypothetical protein